MKITDPTQLALKQGVGSITKTDDASDAFGQMLTNAIKGTVNASREAEKMTMAAASGQDVPMHQVIESVGKAEMTLRTMIAVRDKAVEAYQEVLRMPI